MPVLLLIRHGENDSIAQNVLAGRQPGVHLNEEGRRQAARLVDILRDVKIQAIFSSPLERTMETAAPLAQANRLAVQPAPGWIEADYGAWQGQSFKHLRRLKLWKLVHEKPSAVRFPGGESILEIHQRVVKEVGEIYGKLGKKEVVAVFSHGDVLRIAVTYLLGMPLDEFHRLQIDTGSVTVLTLSDQKPRLHHINITDKFPSINW